VHSRDILHLGSGWGALEMVRRSREGSLANVPPAFVFPEATLGREQIKWLHLLDNGELEEQDPAEIPGEWLVQPEWREILAKSLESEPNRNGYALLHYGVMLAEAFDDEAATAAWQESIQKRPSAWAYRNLGALSAALNKTDDALRYYEKAWELANSSGQPDVSFAQEYLALVYATGDYGKAWTFYAGLPPRLQEHDPIQILRAKIALKLNDLDTVDEVLKREFASIKEGEVNLTDLWFEMWEKRLSAETGRPVDAALRQEVETAYPPPASIDFRVRE
jgi:tetratricopeptide (TPR) repeat protein